MAEVKMFLKMKRNKEFSFAKPLIKIDNKIQDDSLIIILLAWVGLVGAKTATNNNCSEQNVFFSY